MANQRAAGCRVTTPTIAISLALDLLANAVDQSGAADRGCGGVSQYGSPDGPRCLVRHALSHAGIDGIDLRGTRGVHELYVQCWPYVRFSLGALVVIDAVLRAQDRGLSWRNSLDYAAALADRYLDVLPDDAYGFFGTRTVPAAGVSTTARPAWRCARCGA
jgi:hypothetical protein